MTLLGLQRAKEALQAADQGLLLDGADPDLHRARGWALQELERYEEALAAYEEALRLDPTQAWVWSGKSEIDETRERYEEALTACEQALQHVALSAAQHYRPHWLGVCILLVGSAAEMLSLARVAAGAIAYLLWARFVEHAWPFGPKEMKEEYLGQPEEAAVSAWFWHRAESQVPHALKAGACGRSGLAGCETARRSPTVKD
ncbi:MAG: tetratricopeptide repeat protein [Thermogemmatispora sp.]|uniref:tetratricopeptide repeat protein n=1 Tax=Thermogemmatispora sp. TaxID=1968838 RepID=UPI0019F61438|nr:tetratricopeptide repeat protein [Thermogemmatispora sp.]MBE3568353.1 tetratricopeptide repeat protein [Thermogemmatispora sp.]